MSRVILFFPKYESSDAMLLPMSVLSVAAPLVKNNYEVKIIDQRVDRNWKEIILNELKNNPVVFGVSALTGEQILNGLEASKLVKENSNVSVVWGGVHASLVPKQTLENQYIDFVVIGEGEETFLELVNALKQKTLIENIKGVGYKKENKIFINQIRDFVDLNQLPEIPYHLIDIENYISSRSFATGNLGRSMSLYTSRGCPHRCGFCYNKKFNRGKWRGESAEIVVGTIEKIINNYKIKSFNISDDEFFVDLNRAQKICELIIEKNINVEIFTTCRINYVMNMNDEYLKLIYRAGFKTLAFGVESGSEKILDLIHKDITKEQVLETIKRLKKNGINSKYYFMAGFPTETIEDLYKTTDLIYKMKEINPQIRIPAWRVFTPYPGTDLYNLAIKEGWCPPKILEEWASYDFNTVKMPWVKGKIKKIINNVVFMISFIEIDKTRGGGIYFKLAKIFGKIVNWRWKKHLFVLMPEKYLIFLFFKIKNFYNFLKKYKAKKK